MKYLKLVRPHQWVKNLFIIAPLVFSGDADIFKLLISLKMAIVFIFASSAIYVLNDIRDVEYDMRHPERKFRPIANGDINITNATIYFFILLAITIFLVYLLAISVHSILLLCTYMILNLLYTFGFKNIPLLELVILSSGFVIRLMIGSIETGVELSPWIIVCSGLLALMLAVGKRRNELSYQKGIKTTTRIVLKGYNAKFLDQINSMLASTIIVSYLLFCVSQYSIESMNTNIIWSSPMVIFNIIRYLQLVSIDSLGKDPTAILIKDKLSIGIFMSWLIFMGFFLY